VGVIQAIAVVFLSFFKGALLLGRGSCLFLHPLKPEGGLVGSGSLKRFFGSCSVEPLCWLSGKGILFWLIIFQRNRFSEKDLEVSEKGGYLCTPIEADGRDAGHALRRAEVLINTRNARLIASFSL
jgi:hypothetical protein